MNIFNKKIVVSLIAIMTFMTGCGKNIQKEFTEELSEHAKESSASFTLSVPKLELDKDGSEKSPYLTMLTTQLDSLKLVGDYTIESKKDTIYELNLTMDILGKTIPINTVGDIKNTYIQTDYVFSVVDFFASLLTTDSKDFMEQSKLEELQGKYIDIENLSQKQTKRKTNTPIDNTLVQSFNQEYRSSVASYLIKLNKSHYKKESRRKGITVKLQKEELADLWDIYHKISLQDKYKKLFPNRERKKQKNPLDDMETIEFRLTLNEQDNTSSGTIILKPKNTKTYGVKSMVVELDCKNLPFKGTPNLPQEEQILTKEDLDVYLKSIRKYQESVE